MIEFILDLASTLATSLEVWYAMLWIEERL